MTRFSWITMVIPRDNDKNQTRSRVRAIGNEINLIADGFSATAAPALLLEGASGLIAGSEGVVSSKNSRRRRHLLLLLNKYY